ncbi:MAG: hypothetical protein HYZ89_02850 [Candidatus Omnitrophica bacterium]|nr:hypothetical protein [Candidatus Omnitrophota bacterium]
MQSRVMLLLALCLLFSAGCGQLTPVFWQCNFQEESGHAVLDCDKVKIVFEGVKLTSQAGQIFGGSTGSLQVAGSGTSKITLTALHENQNLTNSYSNGVNKISLGTYVVKVLEQGCKLQVGEKTFTLGNDKQTIVIREDGSAEAR